MLTKSILLAQLTHKSQILAVSCFTDGCFSQTADKPVSPAEFLNAHAQVASIAYVFSIGEMCQNVKEGRILCVHKPLLANLVKHMPGIAILFHSFLESQLSEISLGKVICMSLPLPFLAFLITFH